MEGGKVMNKKQGVEGGSAAAKDKHKENTIFMC